MMPMRTAAKTAMLLGAAVVGIAFVSIFSSRASDSNTPQNVAAAEGRHEQRMSPTILVNGHQVEVRTEDGGKPSKALAALLARADDLDLHCRTAIATELDDETRRGDEEAAAWMYLEHHLDELPDLARKLGHDGADESDPELRRSFVKQLVLAGVWASEDKEECVVYFDYSIDVEETQYVLCVSLGYDGELIAIEMES